MTIATNSYGDVDEIASLCPRLADAVTYKFTTATRPTLTQAESFTDQVSSVLNIMLAEQGFKIPISQADCKLALDLFVNQEVAAIAEGINGSGRFGPAVGKGTPKGRYALMMDDVKNFVEQQAAGLQRLGAVRTKSLTEGIAYRDTDESGRPVAPIFQRSGFGNYFENWDSENA